MLTKDDHPITCSVTIMPILDTPSSPAKKIGFLRRDLDDSYPNLLIAPGGSVEPSDGFIIENVKYYSVEEAAVRELWEKTGIRLPTDQLKYLCSLTLPSLTVTLSFYCQISNVQVARSLNYLEFYNYNEITQRDDFAPGMKYEALTLLDKLARSM